jgi:hypothetical protein
MGESTGRFASVLAVALPKLEAETLPATGVVYRFEQG